MLHPMQETTWTMWGVSSHSIREQIDQSPSGRCNRLGIAPPNHDICAINAIFCIGIRAKAQVVVPGGQVCEGSGDIALTTLDPGGCGNKRRSAFKVGRTVATIAWKTDGTPAIT